MWELGAIVTVIIFALGLAYQSGRHSQRIIGLENWRNETRSWHSENLKALEEIRDEIRNVHILIGYKANKWMKP